MAPAGTRRRRCFHRAPRLSRGGGGRPDDKLPVRITVQFYKATSDGVVTEADLDGIQRSLTSTLDHADFVGSLVVPAGDARRPTAWQTVLNEWFPW